jgi:hypothetical protein
MTDIDIPFSNEMADAALRGDKRATTRSEPKGEPGDRFPIKGVRHVLVAVAPIDLLVVRDQLYRIEGFESPAAFEKTWRALHRGHFATKKPRWIHFFARCP